MKKNAVYLLVLVIFVLALSGYAKMGNVDLNEACSYWGLTLVPGNDAYSNYCTDGTNLFSMDLNAYCSRNFGDGFEARYRNFDNPFSWMCMPINSEAFK